MDLLAQELAQAYETCSGYQVAELLRPDPPADNPSRLHRIFRSTNHATVKKDVNKALRKTEMGRLSSEVLQGWSEIIQAYWRALAEIVSMLDPNEVKHEVPPARISPLPVTRLLTPYRRPRGPRYTNYGENSRPRSSGASATIASRLGLSQPFT